MYKVVASFNARPVSEEMSNDLFIPRGSTVMQESVNGRFAIFRMEDGKKFLLQLDVIKHYLK